MKAVLDFILRLRADRLAKRLAPHLPRTGRGLDIGSGTGHTVQALSRRHALLFAQADVVDISVVGPGPILFRETLPFANGTFACSFVLFVLPYPDDPLSLLREANRVTSGPVLVLQSTYDGWVGYVALRISEFLWGPVAFLTAQMTRLIGKRPFTLGVHRLFTRASLRALFCEAGLSIRALHPRPQLGSSLSCDLYVLERQSGTQSSVRDHPGSERRSAGR